MTTKKTATHPTKSRRAAKFLGLLLVAGTLGACNTMGTATPGEGIGYREARFQEIQAVREYRACQEEALQLDAQARANANAAQYLASAKLIDRCERDLGPVARQIAPEQRMRTYALSVQNYLKGGDVTAARQNLDSFKQAFDGQDLYYPDGASFIESMDVLLGRAGDEAITRYSQANLSPALKSEMRRAQYWAKN